MESLLHGAALRKNKECVIAIAAADMLDTVVLQGLAAHGWAQDDGTQTSARAVGKHSRSRAK